MQGSDGVLSHTEGGFGMDTEKILFASLKPSNSVASSMNGIRARRFVVRTIVALRAIPGYFITPLDRRKRDNKLLGTAVKVEQML